MTSRGSSALRRSGVWRFATNSTTTTTTATTAIAASASAAASASHQFVGNRAIGARASFASSSADDVNDRLAALEAVVKSQAAQISALERVASTAQKRFSVFHYNVLADQYGA